MSNPSNLPFPQYVREADSRANLRCVAADLYVGGAIAVMQRPAPTRAWWAAIDLHGKRDTDAFRRELAFGELEIFLRWPFDDGMAVPDGLLDVARSLYERRHGPILVSCAAGVSRSVSVAYAIVRASLGVGHDTALQMCACLGGRPLPATLRSAERWVESLPPRGKVACYACAGIGFVNGAEGPTRCEECLGKGFLP